MYRSTTLRDAIRRTVRALLVVAMAASALFIAAPPADAVDDHVSALQALLPADSAERFAEINALIGANNEWSEALLGAINPDDYVCGPTPINAWVGGLFSEIEPHVLEMLFMAGVPYWSGDWTVLFDRDDSDTYIGSDGGETKEQLRHFRNLQTFWDVDTDDLLLHGMHGSYINDDDKVVPLIQLVLGVPEHIAQMIADEAQALIEAHPALYFDHPLFTLNAFAVPDVEIPGFGNLPRMIVMGDGVIDALNALGLGGSGPDFVLAHEFGHQVQFVLDEAPPYEDPEVDRRTELMADAYGAYFGAHARGATFQAKRIVDVIAGAWVVGDCAFDQPGHHGTPNQRRAAAQWAADLAADARPQGHIVSAAGLVELFDAQLPILVAPDAY